jgi:hypothetical protein
MAAEEGMVVSAKRKLPLLSMTDQPRVSVN